MPNGKTHAKITTVVSVLIPMAAISYGVPVLSSIVMCIGATLGLAINPDLDLSENRVRNDVRHPVRNIIKTIWDLYWFPYGRLIHHRSLVSHSPIFGTLIRSIYMSPIIFSIIYILSQIMPDRSIFNIFVLLFIGLCISDIFHIVADVIVSEAKHF